MRLVQRIEEATMRYSDSRYSIGSVLLAHQNEISTMSLKDVADLSYASKASVVRFAQSFGYPGWKEFHMDLTAQILEKKNHPERVDVNYPFNKQANIDLVASSIAQLMLQSIEDTMIEMDLDMISRVVSLMDRAKRIVIFCVSPHTYNAQLFARKMLTLQKPVQVSNPKEMGITARSLTTQDLAIIISYAGNHSNSEPMVVVPYLKEAHIPIVAITGKGENYLRRMLDNVLTIPDEEHLYTKMATFATEESVLYILNTLFAGFFARHYEEHDRNKVHTASQLEKTRTDSLLIE